MAVSAIDAVNERYATLSLSPLPTLWFNQAELVKPGGGSTSFPIVILSDSKGNRTTTLEATAIQKDEFGIDVYAENLSTTRQTMEAIVWDGNTPETKAGFWYPLTFPTPTGWLFMACIPQDMPVYDEVPDPRAPSAARLHRGQFRFMTQFKRA